MPDNSDNIGRTPHLGPLVEDVTIAEEISGKDLALVLSHYELGAINRIAEYRKGSRRSAKVIVGADKGKYLLKRRAQGINIKTQVLFAHTIQKQLEEHRFPVAGLVSTTNGDSFVEHDGRIYELFRFIKGRRFDKTNPAAAESGRILAHFHNILREFPFESSVKNSMFHQGDSFLDTISEVDDVLKRFETKEQLEGIHETVAFLREQYSTATKQVESVGLSSLPTGIVHGDWHPGNMIYNDGEIIAVIDFDSLRYAQRVTDIANGALQFSMRMGDAEDVEQWPNTFRGHTIQSMVHTYDQFTTLPTMASERSLVPHLMIEALIVESIVPIHKTGSFGRVRGSVFLQMVERKLKWLIPRTERIIEVIQPPLSDEDSFNE